MKFHLKKPDMHSALSRFNISLVYMALALNVIVSWKVYPVDAGSGAGELVSYGWAYGQITGPLGIKEPLPALLVKVLSLSGLPEALCTKALGLGSFIALSVLTLILVRMRYGVVAGAIGALFIAASPYFSYYAVTGPATLLPLLFFMPFLYFVLKGDLTLKNAVFAGVLAGSAALSKIMFLVYAIAALAAVAFQERSAARIKFALYAALAAVLCVTPYLIYQRAAYGSALSLQNNILRHFRNIEMRGPILEAPYSGGPLGVVGFVRADGAAKAAIKMTKGLKTAFFKDLPSLAYYRIELLFGLIGLALLFWRRDILPGALFLVFLVPPAFMANIGQIPVTGGIEPRFYLPALWALCVCAGCGFQGVLDILSAALLGKLRQKKLS